MSQSKRIQKMKRISTHRKNLLDRKPRKDKKVIQGNYDMSRPRKKMHGEKKSRSMGEIQLNGIQKIYAK